jgi:hypothetical protein
MTTPLAPGDLIEYEEPYPWHEFLELDKAGAGISPRATVGREGCDLYINAGTNGMGNGCLTLNVGQARGLAEIIGKPKHAARLAALLAMFADQAEGRLPSSLRARYRLAADVRAALVAKAIGPHAAAAACGLTVEAMEDRLEGEASFTVDELSAVSRLAGVDATTLLNGAYPS